MKRSITSLTLFLFMANSSFAQLTGLASTIADVFSTAFTPGGHYHSASSKDMEGYLSVSSGVSIPKGAFASNDLNNGSAGLAKAGVTFDVSWAIRIKRHFGIASVIRGQVNQLDKQAFAEQLHKNYPTANWTLETNNWKSVQYMLGGYTSFRFGRSRISFESKALVGVVDVITPQIIVTDFKGTNTAWAKECGARGSGFVYLVGAGFKYDANYNLCLFTNVDYLGATAEFENVKLTNNNTVISKGKMKQTIGSLNFGFGIGLRL